MVRKNRGVDIERGQGGDASGHEVSLVTTVTEELRAQP